MQEPIENQLTVDVDLDVNMQEMTPEITQGISDELQQQIAKMNEEKREKEKTAMDEFLKDQDPKYLAFGDLIVNKAIAEIDKKVSNWREEFFAFNFGVQCSCVRFLDNLGFDIFKIKEFITSFDGTKKEFNDDLIDILILGIAAEANTIAQTFDANKDYFIKIFGRLLQAGEQDLIDKNQYNILDVTNTISETCSTKGRFAVNHYVQLLQFMGLTVDELVEEIKKRYPDAE